LYLYSKYFKKVFYPTLLDAVFQHKVNKVATIMSNDGSAKYKM